MNALLCKITEHTDKAAGCNQKPRGREPTSVISRQLSQQFYIL